MCVPLLLSLFPMVPWICPRLWHLLVILTSVLTKNPKNKQCRLRSFLTEILIREFTVFILKDCLIPYILEPYIPQSETKVLQAMQYTPRNATSQLGEIRYINILKYKAKGTKSDPGKPIFFLLLCCLNV